MQDTNIKLCVLVKEERAQQDMSLIKECRYSVCWHTVNHYIHLSKKYRTDGHSLASLALYNI